MCRAPGQALLTCQTTSLPACCVALEMAVRAPESLKGMAWVDGGMINASARYSSVEDAKLEMSPPDFTGVKLEDFRERVRDRHQGAGMAPGSHDVVMDASRNLPPPQSSYPAVPARRGSSDFAHLWRRSPPVPCSAWRG